MNHLTHTIILSILFGITITSNALAGELPKNLKGLTPHQILGLYSQVLEDRNTKPTLPIYTKATQEWKKTWKVTPAQMANEARDIKLCGSGELKTNNDYAVIRYNPANRECSPFFFKMEESVWRMDFLTMMKSIRFNQSNKWHFVLSEKHPYAFAFKDWRFDKNGYPHK